MLVGPPRSASLAYFGTLVWCELGHQHYAQRRTTTGTDPLRNSAAYAHCIIGTTTPSHRHHFFAVIEAFVVVYIVNLSLFATAATINARFAYHVELFVMHLFFPGWNHLPKISQDAAGHVVYPLHLGGKYSVMSHCTDINDHSILVYGYKL